MQQVLPGINEAPGQGQGKSKGIHKCRTPNWEVRDRLPKFISLRCKLCGYVTTCYGKEETEQ